MTTEIFLALVGFCFATVISPGPNNLMLMASGANFGFRRTLPHMAGVVLGLPVMVLPVGFGAMELFEAVPASLTVMQIGAALYMLWLAWKIAHAAAPGEAEARQGRPLTFLQAAGFQYVNPKAWSMALGSIALFAAGRDLAGILWIAATYGTVGWVSASSWTLLGTQIRRLLRNPVRLRAFNWTMAGLLVLSLVPVFLPQGAG